MNNKSVLKRITGSREFLLAVIVIAMFVVVSIFNPAFFSFKSVMDMMKNNAVMMVMALGMLCVMLVGGIDISITSTLALAGMAIGMLLKYDHIHSTFLVFVIAILIGLAAAGHQAWSANLFSTVGDMFPKSAIATITGIGAMAGGVGSMIIQKVAGTLFTYAENAGAAFRFLGFEGKPAGYFIMFCFCGVAYLIAWAIMKSLVPKYKPIEV